MLVTVKIPPGLYPTRGCWRKWITCVDLSQKGSAFFGVPLPVGATVQLPVGAFVLLFDETGYSGRTRPFVVLKRVSPWGTLDFVTDDRGDLRSVGHPDWDLRLRYRAAEAFRNNNGAGTLALVTTEELVAELHRRGSILTEWEEVEDG